MLMTPKVPSSAPVFLLRLDLFIKHSIFHWPSNKLFKIHIYIYSKWNSWFSFPIPAAYRFPHLLYLSKWCYVTDGLHQTLMSSSLFFHFPHLTPSKSTGIFGCFQNISTQLSFIPLTVLAQVTTYSDCYHGHLNDLTVSLHIPL